MYLSSMVVAHVNKDAIQVTNAVLRKLDEETIHIKWRRDYEIDVEDIEEVNEAFYVISENKHLTHLPLLAAGRNQQSN